MLKQSLLAIASAIALGIGFTGSATAVVLDFDSLETATAPGGISIIPDPPYEEDGFQVSGTGSLLSFSQDSDKYAGSAGLWVGLSSGQATVMEAANGDPFTLNSIELSLIAPNATSPPVKFTGQLLGGGTVSQSFTPTEFGFTQFNFNSNFTNLTSVSWIQGTVEELTDGHQFDNIVVTVTDVPEPASILSLLVLSAVAAGWIKQQK
ncbi:MAG: hypothetical protein AB4290_01695 [Spirulina sp.]